MSAVRRLAIETLSLTATVSFVAAMCALSAFLTGAA